MANKKYTIKEHPYVLKTSYQDTFAEVLNVVPLEEIVLQGSKKSCGKVRNKK